MKNIQIEKKNSVTTVTLNRPEAGNAYTEEMITDLVQALYDFEMEEAQRLLVLKSQGKVFCAGGDIKRMQDQSGMFSGDSIALKQHYQNGIQQIGVAFESLSKPTIAVIQGAAVGAGMDLALMCDIRIGCELSSFAQSFVRLGLISGDGGSYFLTRAVGYSKALVLSLTGDKILAEEALKLGILHYQVGSQDLESEAMKICEKLLTLPQQALSWNKKLVKYSYQTDLESVLELASTYQGLLQRTSDHFDRIRSK